MFRSAYSLVGLLSCSALVNSSRLYCRACRLKKKAQYEANKVKLWGLSTEYGTLPITPHTLQFLHQVNNTDDDYCILLTCIYFYALSHLELIVS